MGRKIAAALGTAAAAVGAVVLFGMDYRLAVRRYAVISRKLTAPVRLVFLSDLHSCAYGDGQRELLDLVEAQRPDAVLLGGDWLDDKFDRCPPRRGFTAARGLAERCPTFYVSGNHEVWSGKIGAIKAKLTQLGVRVLSGEMLPLELNGQTIQLCGLDDPAEGEERWARQVTALRQGVDREKFTLLLTHRPERVDDFHGFDLILAGHTHGGEWRIPGLLNGLAAADQGVFPKYAGGEYTLKRGGKLIIGRGLSKENHWIPRLFDRPEVVVVDLKPAGGKR